METAPPTGAPAQIGETPSPGALRLSRIILALGGVQSLTMGLILARSKVLALLISAQGVGAVSVIDQVVQLVIQISTLSLPVAPVKFISRVLHEGTGVVGRTYQALLKLVLLTSLAGALVGVLVVAVRGDLLGRELTAYRGAALVALLTVPGMAVGGLLANVLAAVRRYRDSALYGLALSFASVLAAYVGIRLAGVTGLYYGNLIVGVASAAGAIVYVRIVLGLAPHTSGFHLPRELRRHPDMASFSAVFYVLGFAQPLSLLAARYGVLHIRGLEEVGHLQAAFAISSIVSMVMAQVIRLYLWPAANQRVPKAQKFREVNAFARSCLVLAVLAALTLVLFPREVTVLLFSSAFVSASPVLFAFVVADYLLLAALVFQTVVVGIDDLRSYFVTSMTSHVLLALLPWVLAPGYGLWGVAWAFVAARLVMLLLTLAVLHRRHGFRMPWVLAAIITGSVLALGGAGWMARGGDALSLAGLGPRIGVLLVAAGLAYALLGEGRRGPRGDS